MGMPVKVSKWGNSLAVRLPKALVDQLGLKEGDAAEFAVDGRSAAFQPVATEGSYPKLDEMLAEMKRLMALGVPEPELVDWGPPVGDERLPDDDWSAELDQWNTGVSAPADKITG